MLFFAKYITWLGACPIKELIQLALPVHSFLIDMSYAHLNTVLYVPHQVSDLFYKQR